VVVYYLVYSLVQKMSTAYQHLLLVLASLHTVDHRLFRVVVILIIVLAKVVITVLVAFSNSSDSLECAAVVLNSVMVIVARAQV
jgi:hypothetical protein